MPTTDPSHERVEVPEPVEMLDDVSLHIRLVEFVVILRATVLPKPFRPTSKTVEDSATPTVMISLVGLRTT